MGYSANRDKGNADPDHPIAETEVTIQAELVVKLEADFSNPSELKRCLMEGTDIQDSSKIRGTILAICDDEFSLDSEVGWLDENRAIWATRMIVLTRKITKIGDTEL